MKNLEQIRAKNAMCQPNEKSLVDTAKAMTTMIMDNGLLATSAFAREKGGEYQQVTETIYKHLADAEIHLITRPASIDEFIRLLCNMEAVQLRLITAETMAFMNYMRRLS